MRVGANTPGNDWPTALRAGDDWQFGRASEILEFIYVSFRRLIPYDRIGLALLDPATATLHNVWQRADDPQLLLPRNSSGVSGRSSSPVCRALSMISRRTRRIGAARRTACSCGSGACNPA